MADLMNHEMSSSDKLKILLRKELLMGKRQGVLFMIMIAIGGGYAVMASAFQAQPMAIYQFEQLNSVYNSTNVDVYPIAIPKNTAPASIINTRDFLRLPAYQSQDATVITSLEVDFADPQDKPGMNNYLNRFEAFSSASEL